jgi:hypothetical protein
LTASPELRTISQSETYRSSRTEPLGSNRRKIRYQDSPYSDAETVSNWQRHGTLAGWPTSARTFTLVAQLNRVPSILLFNVRRKVPIEISEQGLVHWLCIPIFPVTSEARKTGFILLNVE